MRSSSCWSAAAAPVDQAGCSLRQTVTADGSGGFTAESSVISRVDPVDCVAAAGTCTFVAGEAVDVAGTLVSHPLSFIPPNTFPGGVNVFPYTDLVDGQSVTVDGVLFDPNAIVGICERTYPFDPSTTTCDGTAQLASADASGHFSTSFTVHPTITQDGVEVDCRVTQCQIVAAEPFASVPSGAATSIYFRVPRPTVVPAATAPVPAEGNSGTTTVEVPVHLSEPSPLTITVPWTTLFVPGAPAGQADPGTDYVAASGTLTFLPGQTDLTVIDRGERRHAGRARRVHRRVVQPPDQRGHGRVLGARLRHHRQRRHLTLPLGEIAG